jgi:hypothetical protein
MFRPSGTQKTKNQNGTLYPALFMLGYPNSGLPRLWNGLTGE